MTVWQKAVLAFIELLSDTALVLFFLQMATDVIHMLFHIMALRAKELQS